MTSKQTSSLPFLFLVLIFAAGSLIYTIKSSSTFSNISSHSQTASLNDSSSGLVGWWKFDEGVGTTVADASGGNANGVFQCSGTNPNWITGEDGTGHALDFIQAGGSFCRVSIASVTPFNITGPITVSSWVKFTDTGNQIYVAKWGTAASYILSASAGKIGFSIWDGKAAQRANSSKTYNDGKWHLVTGIYDGSYVILYVDGNNEIVTGAPYSGTINSSADLLSIGDYSTNGSTVSLKQMDDVRIYNRALLPGEITTMYTSGGGTALPRTTPPARLNGAPVGTIASGSTQSTISLTTDENATCKYGTTAGTAYANIISTFTTTGSTNQSSSITGLVDGISYTYYVRCQDAAGNTNTDDYPITFTVARSNQTNITPPTISAVSAPNIGVNSATISWTTVPAADSQVEYGLTSVYDSHSALGDTNPLVTSHTVSLSGLQANTVYHYRVGSHDSNSNQAISNDYTFTTPVPPAQTLVTPTNFRVDPSSFGQNSVGLTVGFTWSTNTTNQVSLESSTVDPASGGANWKQVNTSVVGGTTVGLNNLPFNVKAWYRIRAYSGSNVSGYSNIVPLTTLIIPTTLVGTVNNASSVSFTWQYYNLSYQNLSGSGYKLERSTDPTFPAGNTTVLNVGQPYTVTIDPQHATIQQINYTDNFAFAPVTYYYRVRAYTSMGDGEASKAISIIPGQVPAQLDIVNVYTYADGGSSASKVKISFGYSSTLQNQTGFRVERSLDSTNWTTLATMATAPSSPYVDQSALNPNQTYFYRVVAFNSVGDSTWVVKKVVIPAIPSSVTSWYVDNSISGGTNDGTGWANAWRNISSINWDVLKPGDTLYISGGVSGQTYNEPLYVSRGGASGNPVTVKTGSDASHNGKVFITGGIVILTQWVTIDGSKSSSFTFSNLENIVNNQNMDVTVNLLDSGCVYASTVPGVKIKWMNIHDCGSPTGRGSLNGEVAGVMFNGFSGSTIQGAEIAYSRISNSWGQGISMSGPVTGYGQASIHHNIIEYNHNDFIIAGGGIDIYNNIARNNIQPGIGHPDGFQIWPPYTRIYNNIIYDTPGQDIYIELNATDDGHFQIYNNIMYVNQVRANSGIGAAIEIDNCSASANPTASVHDILIANNLVYGLTNSNFYGVSNAHNCVASFNTSAATVKNNIFYLPSSVSSVSVGIGQSTESASQISYDNNIVTGGAANNVTFLGVTYPTAADLTAAYPQYRHNSNATPQFVNPASFDFRIASNDTAVGGKGANLSSYVDTNPCGTTACVTPPGLTSDIAGNPRSASGAWSIGPYESASTASDVTPPTAPTNLTSSNVTSTSVNLSWTVSTDVAGVAGYKIYRSGFEAGTVSGATFQDTNLTSGSAYTYTVKAYDTSNNFSAASAPVTVTTPLALDVDSSLVEHIDFQSGFADDPTTPNVFPDVSGHGNNGNRYYMGGSISSGEGWPIKTTGPDGKTAALFRSYTDHPPVTVDAHDYGTGDYVGVPKSASINNLSQATISIWGYYDANSITTATLVDGGGYPNKYIGSWRLGRDFSGNTFFLVYDATNSNHHVITFPDTTTCGGGHTSGDTCNTDGWHLYTVTFDGTTASGYFDGVPIGSGSLAQYGITKLIVGGLGNYIALGAWAHDGTPQWTDSDGYPNCCWLSGGLANFRMYNRVLSPTEIQNLFNATGGTNLANTANTTPAPSTTFSVNDRVQTTAALNVRNTPSISANRLGVQSRGALGTVVGGPTYADGYQWWQIHYDYSPQDGWSVENYLDKSSEVDNRPSVSASVSSASVTLPTSSVTLTGTASDPQTLPLTYLWTASPFTGVTITSPTSLSTTATFTSAGTYTFTLTATNNTPVSSSASVNVAVNPVIVVVIDSDQDGVPDTSDLCPSTPHSVQVNARGCPLPTSTRFSTTDLSSTDLNSIQDLTIENTLGKITFDHAATPYSLVTSGGTSINLDANVTITKTSISLDSDTMSQFKNRPATLTFKNVNISNASLAVIKADNGPCNGCTFVSYNKPVLVIKVPHFTSFSVLEDAISPTLPIISAVTSSSITTSSATITWTTDVSSNSIVDYGTTVSYVSEASSTNTVTSHSINLSGLNPNTLYHFTVRSTDASGNTGTTRDSTFTTAANTVTDLCPNIDGVQTSIPPGMILSGGNCVTPGGGGGGGGGSSFYTLTVTKQGTGLGLSTSTPSGIFCGTSGYSCTYSFYAGSTIVLNAKAQTGSHLSIWTGCTSIAASTCTVLLNSSKTISVTFDPGSATTTILNIASTTTSPVTTAVAPGSPVLGWNVLYTTGPEVTRLKWLLTNGGYATSLSSSATIDSSTLTALQSFQCKTLSVCSGGPYTTGYGATGPKTRAALATLTTKLVGTQSTNNQTPIINNQTSICPANMICTPNATASNSRLSSSFRFTSALHVNASAQDVKNLQIFLNDHGFVVASNGTGSKGSESTYFGPATIKALAVFQRVNGITPAYGNFGAVTMAKVNQMLGK